MTFGENITEFAGKRVVDFEQDGSLQNPADVIPRVRVGYDSEITGAELLVELFQQPESENLTGIVIGMWGEEMYDTPPTEIMETLIEAAPQLPNLTALFLGEMTSEENEVSWIYQCDVSPLWAAYPKLEHLAIRGTNELSLGKMELAYLQSLTIETGGLPKSVLHEVIGARLPELQKLDLYFGMNDYGWDGTVEDVMPLLTSNPFPKLTYLGLRNAEIADQIAQAVAKSPILDQIKILDLSLGTLSDEGASALVDSPGIKNLEKLDLHRHFISNSMMDQLRALPIEVDINEQQPDEPDDRYVAVGE